ncbi:unnamed protein product [Linum trigynum]|uniref:Uncharacterized protein n=1 Tax=Linum trigynum TaxID=586398 RepID=A0AAV2CTZ7_9ROSI
MPQQLSSSNPKSLTLIETAPETQSSASLPACNPAPDRRSLPQSREAETHRPAATAIRCFSTGCGDDLTCGLRQPTSSIHLSPTALAAAPLSTQSHRLSRRPPPLASRNRIPPPVLAFAAPHCPMLHSSRRQP